MTNPFNSVPDEVQEMIDKQVEEVNEEVAEVEAAEVTEPEPPLVIMQRILKKYDNKEGDIPVNEQEYWAARRAFHREMNKD